MANRGLGTYRLVVIACLAGLSWFLPLTPARGQANTPALKLLITMGQPFVAAPDAARIVLHIHNPTQQTLWLYRRAKGKKPPEERISDENRPAETAGGSTVEVKLQPVDAKAASAASSSAAGTVLEYVNMPKPRLVKLTAGGDYEETSIVHIQPARAVGGETDLGSLPVNRRLWSEFLQRGRIPAEPRRHPVARRSDKQYHFRRTSAAPSRFRGSRGRNVAGSGPQATPWHQGFAQR